MTKVIGYVRVSTDGQAERGLGLEDQRLKLAAYATLYDLELIRIDEDLGLSGKTLERPGLTRALASLGAEAEALVVVKLDRLTRSVRDLGTLVDTYFQTHALLSVGEQIDTRSAAGRLVLNVLSSVGQWEREVIAERTKAALARLKGQGKRTGGLPYGFSEDSAGILTENTQEQTVIAAAREIRARGLSYAAIGAELERLGHLTRCGRRFVGTQVQRMLNS